MTLSVLDLRRRPAALPGRSVLRAILSVFRNRPPRLDAALLSDRWRRDLGLDQESQLTPRQEGLLDWARLDRWG